MIMQLLGYIYLTKRSFISYGLQKLCPDSRLSRGFAYKKEQSGDMRVGLLTGLSGESNAFPRFCVVRTKEWDICRIESSGDIRCN